jgi:hypothetical protein
MGEMTQPNYVFIFSYSKNWQLFLWKTHILHQKESLFKFFGVQFLFYFKIAKVYHQHFFLNHWTKLPSILYPSWENPTIILYQWEYYSTNCYLLRAMQVLKSFVCEEVCLVTIPTHDYIAKASRSNSSYWKWFTVPIETNSVGNPWVRIVSLDERKERIP